MKVFSNAGPLIALGKLGQLELLYRLFGQVDFPTAFYQEVVIRGSRRGYSDALFIEVALRRKQLVYSPGIAVDEGYMIVYNEMHRTLALLKRKGVIASS